jgi:hypothetical protein
MTTLVGRFPSAIREGTSFVSSKFMYSNMLSFLFPFEDRGIPDRRWVLYQSN